MVQAPLYSDWRKPWMDLWKRASGSTEMAQEIAAAARLAWSLNLPGQSMNLGEIKAHTKQEALCKLSPLMQSYHWPSGFFSVLLNELGFFGPLHNPRSGVHGHGHQWISHAHCSLLFGAARNPRRRKVREETSGKETVERAVCRATDSFSTNRIAQKHGKRHEARDRR